MKNGLIQATSAYERKVHWTLAISCLVLCVSGMAMMFQSLNFIASAMGGMVATKYIHNFTGIVFTVALVMSIKMWWHEAGSFSMPEDFEWMKVAGGYLWDAKVPEVGKYNPGQKMFFLVVALFGAVIVITGFIMWFPLMFPTWLVRWMFVLHVLGFTVIFPFFFVHLYLGTIGSPGSLQAMTSGWVTRPWVKKHHPKWLKEMEEKGTLIVSDGKK